MSFIELSFFEVCTNRMVIVYSREDDVSSLFDGKISEQ